MSIECLVKVVLVKCMPHVIFQPVSSLLLLSFQNLKSSVNIDRSVAIKVVSLATTSNAEAESVARSVLTEIQMAKRLAKTSGHIVHMYDFDFDRGKGLTYIVMELGQQDLEKALSKRPPLSSAERKAIWRQLVSIAITLHNRQIVNVFYRKFLGSYFLVIYRCILISNL